MNLSSSTNWHSANFIYYISVQCQNIVLYVSLYCPSFIDQNSGIILTMTMKSNNTQDLTSIEVSQLQYLPPLPWIWAWPTQCPDTLWAELQMWRIHNLNQPGPWWWKLDQLFCWNLIKPTHLCFPTMPENSMSLLATSWGCSIKFVVESITPKV